MINKQKIYVAGPYTQGDTILNIRESILVANELLKYGFIPFVPHLTGIWHLIAPNSYFTWMAYDIEWLKVCDAVRRLDGDSVGADKEVQMANKLGIPVFYNTSNLVKYFTGNE